MAMAEEGTMETTPRSNSAPGSLRCNAVGLSPSKPKYGDLYKYPDSKSQVLYSKKSSMQPPLQSNSPTTKTTTATTESQPTSPGSTLNSKKKESALVKAMKYFKPRKQRKEGGDGEEMKEKRRSKWPRWVEKSGRAFGRPYIELKH